MMPFIPHEGHFVSSYKVNFADLAIPLSRVHLYCHLFNCQS